MFSSSLNLGTTQMANNNIMDKYAGFIEAMENCTIMGMRNSSYSDNVDDSPVLRKRYQRDKSTYYMMLFVYIS